MNINELKTQPDSELLRELSEKRKELQHLRFDLAQGRMKNVRVVREVRRTIARILTVIAQRKTSV